MPFINDLLASARNYQRLRDIGFTGEAKKLIRSLRHLQDEWLPTILSFLNRSTREECFSEQDFCAFLSAFEKVYYQGWIRKLIKSKREIMYFEILTRVNNGHALSSIIEGVNIYAENRDFENHLKGDLYEPSPNKIQMVKAVLMRLEEEMQDDSVEKSYHRITIEHILPQNMKEPYWQERFSNESHTQWVQKLGNLTLLGGAKNSSAQNHGFPKKLESYRRNHKRVSFDITKEICELSDWTEQDIVTRHNRLVRQALELWSITATSILV